jgi:import inner membrane translocase subunit TIM16
MELREALLILNVEKGATVDQIKEKYENMFKANDPKNGGSLYLQAKVFRAKERLDFELKENSSQ